MGQQTWWDTRFLGLSILKCPLDLWIYQEIIHELRPDVIVETGTAFGGSALYMASFCELIGSGRVITIDITAQDGNPKHERITYLTGSSVVTKGSYLIVEDTNVFGHPVRRSHGPGPMEAVESFLTESDQFAVDNKREKFYLTFNPKGYLKKIA